MRHDNLTDTPRIYASVFKSKIDRFKVKPTAGAEVRVLAYSSGETIEKSVRYFFFLSVSPLCQWETRVLFAETQ